MAVDPLVRVTREEEIVGTGRHDRAQQLQLGRCQILDFVGQDGVVWQCRRHPFDIEPGLSHDVHLGDGACGDQP